MHIKRKRLDFISDNTAVSIVVGLILLVSISSGMAATSYVFITSTMQDPPKIVCSVMDVRAKESGFEILYISGEMIDSPLKKTYSETSIETQGLIVHLDATNPKSYPGAGGNKWYDLQNNADFHNHGLVLENKEGIDSFKFDGENGFHTPDDPNVDLAGSFTIEIWYYYDGAASGSMFSDYMYSMMSHPSPPDILCFLENGRIKYSWNSFYSGPWGFSPVLIPNHWNHIVITRSKEPNGNRIGHSYIDGSNSGETSVTTAFSADCDDWDLIIGKDILSGAISGGYISVLRIYDRALTPEEINGNYDAGIIVEESMTWNNIEVWIDGDLIAPKNVASTPDDTFSPGGTIQIDMPLSAGAHPVEVVYTPTDQVVYSGTIYSEGVEEESPDPLPPITVYSTGNADGNILKWWGVEVPVTLISTNDSSEANLKFYESSATPVWWSTYRNYLSFDTSSVGDLTGKEVTLWVKMKRNGPLNAGSKFWIYYGHDAIGPDLTETDHDCCTEYTGHEINPTGYETTYEWKSWVIPNEYINTEGYTDFEFKPNRQDELPPLDSEWAPTYAGDPGPNDIYMYMTEADGAENDPYLEIKQYQLKEKSVFD